MQTVTTEVKTCPKCGKTYKGHSAISREDNITAICPLCGTRESLKSMGLKLDEIEKIILTIPCIEEK